MGRWFHNNADVLMPQNYILKMAKIVKEIIIVLTANHDFKSHFGY